MQIKELSREGVLVVALDGRLDSNTSGALEAVLPARIQSNDRVVLDLSQVFEAKERPGSLSQRAAAAVAAICSRISAQA